MLYPGRFESKVGLDIVRQHLHDLCLSNAGQEYVANIQVESDPHIINLKLDQAEEMREVSAELLDTASLFKKIDWLIDDRGRIKDKASADLFRIRHDILRLQAQ